MFYYLQFLDFDWIVASFEPLRRTLIKATFEEEGKESEIIDPQRYTVSAKEVLDSILERHERKFEKLVEIKTNTEDVEEQAKRIFDLFLFINKVVIWFILRKNTGTEEVNGIIDRMIALVGTQERFWYSKKGFGYFDRIQEITGRENFLKLFHEIDVVPHLIILSNIIVKVTKEQPSGKRILWKRQLNNILRNACAIGNGQKEVTDFANPKMEKVMAEYREYEAFSFNSDKLWQQAEKRLLK